LVDDWGFGVTFNANIENGSEQIISGIFIFMCTISSQIPAPKDEMMVSAIYFVGDIAGDTIISGTFIIGCSGYGVLFKSQRIIHGHIIIDGKFVIYSGPSFAMNGYGSTYFQEFAGTSSGILDMTSAKFFARGGDRTNIFQTSFDSCTYE
jgi:hypothetical protein